MNFRAIILISGNLAKQKAPHNQHYPCTVLIKEEEWRIGGLYGGSPIGAVFTYNKKTKLVLPKPHMNQGRWRSSCAFKSGSTPGGNNNSSIIVVGGLTGTDRFTSSVEIFSGKNWEKWTPFPVKICCGTLVYDRNQDIFTYSKGITGRIFTVW